LISSDNFIIVINTCIIIKAFSSLFFPSTLLDASLHELLVNLSKICEKKTVLDDLIIQPIKKEIEKHKAVRQS